MDRVTLMGFTTRLAALGQEVTLVEHTPRARLSTVAFVVSETQKLPGCISGR